MIDARHYAVRDTLRNGLEVLIRALRPDDGERIAEEEKPYLITELPDSWVVEGAKLPYEVAGGVFIIEINKKNGCVLNFLHSK